MADIRQYNRGNKNTQKIEKKVTSGEEFDRRIKAHRNRRNLILIILGLVIIIGIFVFVLIKVTSNYHGYRVVEKTEREDSGYAQYLDFGDGYAKCTKDGISYCTYNGTQVWNKSYEVDNMKIVQTGDYLAVADLDGNTVNLFQPSGFVSTINTALSIVQVSLSDNGEVAVVLKDTNADYVNLYDKEGNKIYTNKTTISKTGVPVSAGVSPDGEKIIISFSVVSGTSLKNSVVFYSLNEVGQNENDRIVGGFDTYKDALVGDVRFLNTTDAIACSEKIVSFYSIKEYPELSKDVTFDNEIRKIFYSGKYVGVVTEDPKDLDHLKLQVFNTSGDELLSKKIKDDYATFKFAENSILMYNDKECELLNMSGSSIFEETFTDGINSLVPVDGNRNYLYISGKYIEKIRLK